MSPLVDKAAKFLETKLSRRGFINRSAFIGSAVAVGSGLDLALKPGTAYGSICNYYGSECACGSTCGAGYSEFCCTLNGGYNYCPTGTIMGGWWKADGSVYCDGPRFYMDCNAQCGCGCPSGTGFCSTGCDGVNCGCALGNCNNFVSGCFQFRYGQCNQDVPCIGRIVCRVVACVPPWEVDSSCTQALAVDDGTANQNVACWTSAPPSPPPPPFPPPPPPEPPVQYPGDSMESTVCFVGIRYGKGWAPSPVPTSTIVSVVVESENPEVVGGYDNVPTFQGVTSETGPDSPNGAITFVGPTDGNWGFTVWSVT